MSILTDGFGKLLFWCRPAGSLTVPPIVLELIRYERTGEASPAVARMIEASGRETFYFFTMDLLTWLRRERPDRSPYMIGPEQERIAARRELIRAVPELSDLFIVRIRRHPAGDSDGDVDVGYLEFRVRPRRRDVIATADYVRKNWEIPCHSTRKL